MCIAGRLGQASLEQPGVDLGQACVGRAAAGLGQEVLGQVPRRLGQARARRGGAAVGRRRRQRARGPGTAGQPGQPHRPATRQTGQPAVHVGQRRRRHAEFAERPRAEAQLEQPEGRVGKEGLEPIQR